MGQEMKQSEVESAALSGVVDETRKQLLSDLIAQFDDPDPALVGQLAIMEASASHEEIVDGTPVTTPRLGMCGAVLALEVIADVLQATMESLPAALPQAPGQAGGVSEQELFEAFAKEEGLSLTDPADRLFAQWARVAWNRRAALRASPSSVPVALTAAEHEWHDRNVNAAIALQDPGLLALAAHQRSEALCGRFKTPVALSAAPAAPAPAVQTVYECADCDWSGHTESNCPRCAAEVTTASAAEQPPAAAAAAPVQVAQAYLDAEGDRVVTASQMHSMLNHQGEPGKKAAQTYTVALVASPSPASPLPVAEEQKDGAA